jgi:hypothetical protein
MPSLSSPRKLEADDSAGPLRAIEEGDPVIDEVPRGVSWRGLFADEKFMNELVTIMLHPSQDTSEMGVPVSVNGLRAYLIPGRPMKVRRLHVAQLLKARPDIVIHRSDDPYAPETEHNRMYRQSSSRYNFDVLEDTPRGIMWLKELRAQYFK